MKLLTSKSVLRNDLDLVEGEIKLVEVLQLEKRLTGHLAQRVPCHVQAEQVPGEGGALSPDRLLRDLGKPFCGF